MDKCVSGEIWILLTQITKNTLCTVKIVQETKSLFKKCYYGARGDKPVT